MATGSPGRSLDLANAWLESVSTAFPRFSTGLSSHREGKYWPCGRGTSFTTWWEVPDTAGRWNSWGRAVTFSSPRDCGSACLRVYFPRIPRGSRLLFLKIVDIFGPILPLEVNSARNLGRGKRKTFPPEF